MSPPTTSEDFLSIISYFLCLPLRDIQIPQGFSPCRCWQTLAFDKETFPSSSTAFAETTSSRASAPPTPMALPLERAKGTSVFMLMSVQPLTFWFSQRHLTPVVPCAKGEACRCHKDRGWGAGGGKWAKCSMLHRDSSTCAFTPPTPVF